jgi:uncharacterized protein
MSEAFREVLSQTALVDHHAHGILRDPPASLDEFRGLFSESPDPRQWPHVASAITYVRAIEVLAAHLGCEPTEDAVYQRRLSTDPAQYASTMLRATGTELLFVDEGFPSADVGTGWEELGELAGCQSRPVMRIELVAESLSRGATDGGADAPESIAAAVAGARGRGYVALKTILAYRGGLDLDALPEPSGDDRIEGRPLRDVLLAALEANESTGDPLPVQIHTGFGDSDLLLPAADPGHLKPVIERFSNTTFVLLHCYPFVREAGWLAHVYPNVYFDLSLTIPHVSQPARALTEALELAPVSKLLYASDASRACELYLLAATWWRDALEQVLPTLLAPERAATAARMILRDNALGVYGLSGCRDSPKREGGS